MTHVSLVCGPPHERFAAETEAQARPGAGPRTPRSRGTLMK
ncbi:hypothetical protein [Streptomyces mirabilis]